MLLSKITVTGFPCKGQYPRTNHTSLPMPYTHKLIQYLPACTPAWENVGNLQLPFPPLFYIFFRLLTPLDLF